MGQSIYRNKTLESSNFCPLTLQRQTYGLLLSEDSQINPRGIKHRCPSRINEIVFGRLGVSSLRNPAGRKFNIARYRDVPCSDLIALYILADALQVHNLKDPIVTRIIDVYGFSGSTERDSNDDKEEGKEQEGHEEGEEEEKGSQRGRSILENEDDVIDEITTLFWSLNRPPGLEDPIKGINMAWETLPSMSPLCQVLVRCFCDNVVNVKARTGEQDYYAGFLTAVVHSYALRWVRGDEAWQTTDWNKKGEIYKSHEHGSTSECAFAERERIRVTQD